MGLDRLLNGQNSILDHTLGLLADLVRELDRHLERLGLGRPVDLLLSNWNNLSLLDQVLAGDLLEASLNVLVLVDALGDA